MTNPAVQLTGVFAPELTTVLAEVLVRLGMRRAIIVWGEGNLDEMTVTGATHIADGHDGQVTTSIITPEDMPASRRCSLPSAAAGPRPRRRSRCGRCSAANPGPSWHGPAQRRHHAHGRGPGLDIRAGIDRARDGLAPARPWPSSTSSSPSAGIEATPAILDTIVARNARKWPNSGGAACPGPKASSSRRAAFSAGWLRPPGWRSSPRPRRPRPPRG